MPPAESALGVPRRKDGLHVREIDGETVILDAAGERMHTLNTTAAFIFASIDGRRTVKDIAEEVARNFEVDAALAESDTRDVVRRFAEEGLVSVGLPVGEG